MSERCQACGIPYPDVYRLPNDLWERIADGLNLLCPGCVMERADERGIVLYWEAAEGRYPMERPA